MADIKSLKVAFIEFIDKILPSITDPMAITQQKCQMLINLLKDEKKTIQDVVLFISNLKIANIKPQTQNLLLDDKVKSPNKPKQIDRELFQPESYFKLNLPNKDLIIKKSSYGNLEKSDSPKLVETIDKQTEDTQTPLKLGIETIKKTPKMNSNFNMFFQQTKGFSVVTREYILDDLQQGMKEFQRHTKIMGCIEQRTFEVNSGEITEVDKKLHQQNYNFSTYSRQVQRQKSFKKMSIFEQKKQPDGSQNKQQPDSKPQDTQIKQLENTQGKETVKQQEQHTANVINTSKPSLYSYRTYQRLQQNQPVGSQTYRETNQQTENNIQHNNNNQNLQISEQTQDNKVSPKIDLNIEPTIQQTSEIIKIGTITTPTQSIQKNVTNFPSQNFTSLPVSPNLLIPQIQQPQSQSHSREQSQVEETKVEQKPEGPYRISYTRFNYTQQRLEKIRENLLQNNYKSTQNNEKQADLRLDFKQIDQNF